jgi:hypothetical protein
MSYIDFIFNFILMIKFGYGLEKELYIESTYIVLLYV